ncbi:MAG: dipeptide epimerase [Euryarchaeota archaeon]|nr:dipeptide epimerase [Euryarchaeota archaeon]
MDIDVSRRDLKLKRPFVISAGASDLVTVVRVKVTDGKSSGLGEASPSLRVTGETVASVEDVLGIVRRQILSDRRGLDAGFKEARTGISGNGSAMAALDMAILDLRGKEAGRPARRLLRLPKARLATSKTVSLAEPKEMAEEAALFLVEGYGTLKIKLGAGPKDAARIAAVRAAAPKARLRVDANAGWDPRTARRMLDALEDNRVELLEQPVSPRLVRDLRDLTAATKIPVFADESVKTVEDVEFLAATKTVRGINVKLMKSGGIRPAADLLKAARKRRLKTMIGCMIESSVAISAAAQLLALADFADLDGADLIANDDYAGASIVKGVISTPDGPGLGLSPL